MVTVELRAVTGVSFRDGAWVAEDAKTREKIASLTALCKGAPRRAFGRSPEVLDAERAARLASGASSATLPDLNRFYEVEGDADALGKHELVASAVATPPLTPAPRAIVEPTAADTKAHERDARGQGICLATMGATQDLEKLAPEAMIDIVPAFLSLGDAIDRATAQLAGGDVLLVPYTLATPSALAAATHAVARGVVLVTLADAPPVPGVLASGSQVGATRLAGHAACAQSYAVGIGLARLSAAELHDLCAAGDLGKAIDALDARAAARAEPRPLVKVILEEAKIVVNGDVGAAEIYFEGWVDDGAGGRRAFRIPHEGHVPNVQNGQTIPLNTEIFASSTPVGDALRVHVEAWDEDLGRESLIDPDDLLGVHERAYGRAEKWGEGRHAELRSKTDAGEWLLTYRIEASLD